MLVLNRQPGHAVLFTGGIRVVILECSKRGVRIGIEAPSTVGIVREEIVTRNAGEQETRHPAGTSTAVGDSLD